MPILSEDFTFQLGDFGVTLNTDANSLPFVDIDSVNGLDNAPYRTTERDHEGVDGGWMDAEFEKGRPVTLEGTVYTDGTTMETYLDSLKTNYAPSRTLIPFYFKAPGQQERVLFVKPLGCRYDWTTARRLGYSPIQFQMFAEDPRIYTANYNTFPIVQTVVDTSGRGYNRDYSYGYGDFDFGPILNNNPYFETDVTNWFGQSGLTTARSTAQFHEGAASMEMTPPVAAGSNVHVDSESVPVIAGTSYTASGWLKSTPGISGTGVRINWFSSSMVFISSSGSNSALPAATWTQYTTEATAPGGAAWATITIGWPASPAVTDIIFGDELMIRQTSVNSEDLTTDQVELINNGNRPTPVLFVIQGPATNPVIINDTLGLDLLFEIALGASDTLTVDTVNHTVVLNGGTNRRGVLVDPNWFLLQPGSNFIRFRAASAGPATLFTSWRDAWR